MNINAILLSTITGQIDFSTSKKDVEKQQEKEAISERIRTSLCYCENNCGVDNLGEKLVKIGVYASLEMIDGKNVTAKTIALKIFDTIKEEFDGYAKSLKYPENAVELKLNAGQLDNAINYRLVDGLVGNGADKCSHSNLSEHQSLGRNLDTVGKASGNVEQAKALAQKVKAELLKLPGLNKYYKN